MILVRNTGPLRGEIEIQGSKNGVLPMMAAALLAEGCTKLTNVPRSTGCVLYDGDFAVFGMCLPVGESYAYH